MGPAGRVYRYCLSGRNKYNADNRSKFSYHFSSPVISLSKSGSF
jgi:hypothetical protein